MFEACRCEPEFVDGNHYIPWVGKYFGDCIYSQRQYVAVISGLISLILFGVALVPQAWKNYKAKSVEGFSFSLLLSMLLGDFFNFAGAILTLQFPTQQLTGLYFLFIDLAVVLQYIHYAYGYNTKWGPSLSSLARNISNRGGRQRREQGSTAANLDDTGELVDDGVQTEGDALIHEEDRRPLAQPTNVPGGGRRTLLNSLTIHSFALMSASLFLFTTTSAMLFSDSIESNPSSLGVGLQPNPRMPGDDNTSGKLPICDAPPHITPVMYWSGVAMAWSSGLLYFLSRVPQLLENRRNQSVEGISMMLFFITLWANSTYGISILARADELTVAKMLQSTFPYLLGSIGTFVFDITIFYQAYIYRPGRIRLEDSGTLDLPGAPS